MVPYSCSIHLKYSYSDQICGATLGQSTIVEFVKESLKKRLDVAHIPK